MNYLKYQAQLVKKAGSKDNYNIGYKLTDEFTYFICGSYMIIMPDIYRVISPERCGLKCMDSMHIDTILKEVKNSDTLTTFDGITIYDNKEFIRLMTAEYKLYIDYKLFTSVFGKPNEYVFKATGIKSPVGIYNEEGEMVGIILSHKING